MVQKTSRVNKQDIRNKAVTKSKIVKQVPAITKTHSGRHALHRHLTMPLGILLRNMLCQDVPVSQGLQQHLLGYPHSPQQLLFGTAITLMVCPEGWSWVLKGRGEIYYAGTTHSPSFRSHSSLCDHSLLLLSQSHLFLLVHFYPFGILNTICFCYFNPHLFPNLAYITLMSSSMKTQLKTRKSLLKERIKHIFLLIATRVIAKHH